MRNTTTMQASAGAYKIPLLPHLTVDVENPSTRASYRADLLDFNTFVVKTTAADLGEPPIAPRLIADYIDDMHRRRAQASTIRRRLCAIRAWYTDAGIDTDPRRHTLVQRAWDTVRNDEDRSKVRKLGVTHNFVAEMLAALDEDYDLEIRHTVHTKLIYLRDRALILTMYTGGLTRTEAATLYRENVLVNPERNASLILKVNASGEMEKNGKRVWVTPRRERLAEIEPSADPTRCAVKALAQWFHVAGITSGYAFRGIRLGGSMTDALAPRSIHAIIRARAARIASAEVEIKKISTHSLRSGRAGVLALRGATNEQILAAVGLTDLDDSMSAVVASGRSLSRSSAGESVRLL
jgi:site-specific recombinase XerD